LANLAAPGRLAIPWRLFVCIGASCGSRHEKRLAKCPVPLRPDQARGVG
jgi:hypothetical protein